MNKANLTQQTKNAGFMPPVHGLLQRQCACGNHTVAGGECTECAKNKSRLQRKLAIGASNDPLEQEADRVADQVMTMSLNSDVKHTLPRIQRFTGQSSEGVGEAPASVERVLASSGRQLEPTLRQDMESRFGHDFSNVRVHTESDAAQSARDVNALAYTVGNNVVFGAGQFAPQSNIGRRLIAHELTHTIQQNAVKNPDPNTKWRQLSTISSEMLQRDGEFNVPTLNDLYNNALQVARQTGDFRDAAEKLNGFNHEDIQIRLAQLTQDEVRYMHLGALDNPRLGSNSQVAQLTAPGTPRASTVPPASTQTPTVSAVTSTRTPTPPTSTQAQISSPPAQEGLSTGAIIGIVVGVALVAGAVVLFATPGGQALGFAIILSISEVGGGGAAIAAVEAGTPVLVEGIAAVATGGEAIVGAATAGEVIAGGATATAGVTSGATATVVVQSAATEAAIASSSSLAAQVTVGTTAAAAATTLSSDSSPSSERRRRNNCFEQNPFAIPCEDEIDMDEQVLNFIMIQGYSYESLGDCRYMSSFAGNTIQACSGAAGQSFHCEVYPYYDPVARASRPGGEVSVFGCECCRDDGTLGIEFRPDHWSGGK